MALWSFGIKSYSFRFRKRSVWVKIQQFFYSCGFLVVTVTCPSFGQHANSCGYEKYGGRESWTCTDRSFAVWLFQILQPLRLDSKANFGIQCNENQIFSFTFYRNTGINSRTVVEFFLEVSVTVTAHRCTRTQWNAAILSNTCAYVPCRRCSKNICSGQ